MTGTHIIAFSAVTFYLASALLISQKIYTDQSIKSSDKRLALWLGMAGICLHALILFSLLKSEPNIHLNVTIAASLVGWLIAVLLTVGSIRHPMESLIIFIYPAAALSLILQQLLPDQHLIATELAFALRLHILFSIVAYSLLSIAAFQALVLAYADNRLKNRHPVTVIRTLPPLQTMEILLFRMIWLGFIFLTISLFTGLPYINDIFGQHLIHKTVLSITAWFVFAILLWGHQRFGWRGRTAINFTLAGMFILLLAYFGSKAVLELILHKI